MKEEILEEILEDILEDILEVMYISHDFSIDNPLSCPYLQGTEKNLQQTTFCNGVIYVSCLLYPNVSLSPGLK